MLGTYIYFWISFFGDIYLAIVTYKGDTLYLYFFRCGEQSFVIL